MGDISQMSAEGAIPQRKADFDGVITRLLYTRDRTRFSRKTYAEVLKRRRLRGVCDAFK